MTGQRRRSSRSARLLPVFCATIWAAAFVVTHLPRSHIPRLGAGDKTLHAVGYFVLAGVFLLALASRGTRRLRRAATVIAIMAIYATIDEATQPLVGRCASLTDWAFDMCGVLAAVVLLEATLAALARRGRLQAS